MNVSMFCSITMCMFGIIWGIFIPACLWLVPVGLGAMAIVAHKDEE